MKKILFLLPHPPPYAGQEIIAKEIYEINKNNHDFIFVNANIRKSNKDKGKLDIKGINTFIKIYLRFLINLFKVKKVFLFFASNKLSFIKDSCFILTAKLMGKQIVGGYHGANFKNFYQNQNYIYQKFIRLTLNSMSLILVNLDKLHYNFNFIVPQKKIKTLENGLNIAKYPYNFKKHDSQIFNLFFMGHLSYTKGFYHLIEAYKICRSL